MKFSQACDFPFGARVSFWFVSDNAFFQIAFNIIMPDYNYAIFKNKKTSKRS